MYASPGGRFKTALVVGAGVLSRYVDWTDGKTCIFFWQCGWSCGTQVPAIGLDSHSGKGQSSVAKGVIAVLQETIFQLLSKFPIISKSTGALDRPVKEALRLSGRWTNRSIDPLDLGTSHRDARLVFPFASSIQVSNL
ncbi:3-oxoacyl-[acyl-carrier-protein] synthase 3 B, chloroplastic-like [Selaginella moellendorffii]|uniref:3-oxoacyl-[acyl-carrier-protein] synthase 3 B, chloroplastic-like n=1 Tax=Selaginella moellendorffii TaxID=88036 RepID=UPI000D1CE17F|nr:3-oxoacyl-[acyl-carrier-protein] synthase 3 B, chloroplastic-like [Selaginella moellendorffii]|eukprot:XP_024545470.1 3-oxoacyl-[acyl-carrier-protein] synthase 3 B, chloroplastic-like [Selaginella moellendorffii]